MDPLVWQLDQELKNSINNEESRRDTCLIYGDINVVHQRVKADGRPEGNSKFLGNQQSELQSRFGGAFLLENMLAAKCLDTFPRQWSSSVSWTSLNKNSVLSSQSYHIVGPSWWHLSDGENRLPITQYDIEYLPRTNQKSEKRYAWRITDKITITPSLPFYIGKISINNEYVEFKGKDQPKKFRGSIKAVGLVVSGEGFLSSPISEYFEGDQIFELPLFIKYKRGVYSDDPHIDDEIMGIAQDKRSKIRHNLYELLQSRFIRCNQTLGGENERTGFKTIVQLNANDIRSFDNIISRGRSWERTIQDSICFIHRAITDTHSENHFSFLKFVDVVAVSFAPDAVLLVEIGEKARQKKAPSDDASISNECIADATLVACMHEIEGDCLRSRPGGTRGYESCISASILDHMMGDSTNSNLIDLSDCVKRGLHASRYLQNRGFTPVLQSILRSDIDAFISDWDKIRNDLDLEIVLPKKKYQKIIGPASQRIPSLNYPYDVIGHILRSKSKENCDCLNKIVWIPGSVSVDFFEILENVIDEIGNAIDIKNADQQLSKLEEIRSKFFENDEWLTRLWDIERQSNSGLARAKLFLPKLVRFVNESLQHFSAGATISKEIVNKYEELKGELKGLESLKEMLTCEYLERITELTNRVETDWVEGVRGVEVVHVSESALRQCNRIRLISDVGPISSRPSWHFKNSWSLMQSAIGNRDSESEAFKIAFHVLKSGHKALVRKQVPVFPVGKYVAVDRWEIESMREISVHLNEYVLNSGLHRPLNVGVFGPPGTGKSFVVKEILNSLGFDDKIVTLSFNLSQFSDPKELYQALHRVRDASIEGKVPVVFWDEFDCEFNGMDFGWLKYFLAPMQDGKFQEGQSTHSIGRAVFCFAGGVFSDVSEILNSLEFDQDDTNADNQAMRKVIRESDPLLLRAISFRKAKGRDFVSRLVSTLSVAGIEKVRLLNRPVAGSEYSYMFRRALLIRSLLKSRYPQLERVENIEVSPRVAAYVLRDARYRHGARSVEALIALSEVHDRDQYLAVDLPSDAEMSWHVYS